VCEDRAGEESEKGSVRWGRGWTDGLDHSGRRDWATREAGACGSADSDGVGGARKSSGRTRVRGPETIPQTRTSDAGLRKRGPPVAHDV